MLKIGLYSNCVKWLLSLRHQAVDDEDVLKIPGVLLETYRVFVNRGSTTGNPTAWGLFAGWGEGGAAATAARAFAVKTACCDVLRKSLDLTDSVERAA
jgi:hypothetical protein